MKFVFQDVALQGLLVVVPEHESRFEDEMENYDFPIKNSQKLQRVMGFDRHRVVKSDTCASDLAYHGLQTLIQRGQLRPEEIDGLVFVSETPDYFMPPTSNVLQGKLQLDEDTWCIDINQGCAGFVVGLMQCFMMLQQEGVEQVVLINADTLTRTCSPQDRNAYPLMGDAASIALVTRADRGPVHAHLKMDGTQHQAIMIPAGGFRLSKTADTAKPVKTDDNNVRSLDDYHMDGIAVFNFAQTRIPPLIDELLASAGTTKEAVDWYMFHQPNRFMLEKLADQMGVPRDKMPNQVVERYGNNSSATVPTAMVDTLASRLTTEPFTMCLCGFGVGLTWAAMLLEVGPLAFCEMIDFVE